jgi:hypothetical protein
MFTPCVAPAAVAPLPEPRRRAAAFATAARRRQQTKPCHHRKLPHRFLPPPLGRMMKLSGLNISNAPRQAFVNKFTNIASSPPILQRPPVPAIFPPQ